MHSFLLAQLCLAAAVSTGSPVQKVVELIKELKTKVETDGANEQKLYDKFACWCETTSQRKADAIDGGKATIATTTTTILTLKGAISVLEGEIADAEAMIAKGDDAMKKLTSIREKENGAYQEEKSYMETTLSSLHSAIEVLGGAGTGGDMGLLKVAATVRSAILQSPHVDALSDASTKLLKQFLENPTSFLQQDPVDYYDKKAQAKASYSPQSATVTGILKDMYTTFAADAEKANQEESNFQKAFEDEMKVKTDSNKVQSELITQKEGQKAEKAQLLDENEMLLASTQEQLKLDETIFVDTRDQCKDKSDDWDERQRLRTDQMVGINKALEILTADSARETFQGSAKRTVEIFGGAGVKGLSFIQTQSSASEQAYLALKRVIHSEPKKNLRLARLAATVRTASKGHFDAVIASVEGMIQTIHDEGEADTEQKYWCISETDKNERDKSNSEYKISQLDAKIKRAQVKKADLEADKAKTLEANATLTQTMIEAKEDREAQSAEYVTAKAEDIQAISLLADAMAALSEYGENNAFVQKQPVYEMSEDAAPQEQFSSADSHSGAQTGVIKLMAAIKEDLENEVSMATKAEAKAALEFLKLRAAADQQHAAYDAEVVNLEDSIAATDESILKYGESKSDTQAELDATNAYLARIKPNCDWILGAFDSRQAARRAERDGLMEAESVLAGSAPANVGFLQKVA